MRVVNIYCDLCRESMGTEGHHQARYEIKLGHYLHLNEVCKMCLDKLGELTTVIKQEGERRLIRAEQEGGRQR